MFYYKLYSKNYKLIFKLQPYKETKVYIDNNLIKPKILKVDNSLAVCSIMFDHHSSIITFKHRNFDPKNRPASIQRIVQPIQMIIREILIQEIRRKQAA